MSFHICKSHVTEKTIFRFNEPTLKNSFYEKTNAANNNDTDVICTQNQPSEKPLFSTKAHGKMTPFIF